jgi:transposase
VTESDLATIEATRHGTELSPRQRERLELVKGAAHGWTLSQRCAWRGRTARTVQRWLSAYEHAGIAALPQAASRGRACRAAAAYLAALAQAVTAEPRDLHQPFDVWTSSRLRAYLAETTTVRISPGWVPALVHQHGFAHGRPKHSLAPRQDGDEIAVCQRQLAEVGEKGAG